MPYFPHIGALTSQSRIFLSSGKACRLPRDLSVSTTWGKKYLVGIQQIHTSGIRVKSSPLGLDRHHLHLPSYFNFSRHVQSNASNSSSPDTHTVQVPDLVLPPPIPYTSRTTELLTKPEAEQFLYPLHFRGWTIKSLAPNVGLSIENREYPFLCRTFRLKGSKSARKFLKELTSIQEQEKHDVSFNLWSGKRPVLTVLTQTHSARKSLPSESVSEDTTEPGITLRDIRIAVLLEIAAKDLDVLFWPQDNQNSHEIPYQDPVSTFQELLSRHPWK